MLNALDGGRWVDLDAAYRIHLANTSAQLDPASPHVMVLREGEAGEVLTSEVSVGPAPATPGRRARPDRTRAAAAGEGSSPSDDAVHRQEAGDRLTLRSL
ncbi:MAG TPA: hypothetical protein VKK19_14875 [Candidatus Dormibacteraeota bacterium]|nr:hypothetical protein [Candidatus Dormibacteraeota bacterium]